jgi:L-rhamnose mutarotase
LAKSKNQEVPCYAIFSIENNSNLFHYFQLTVFGTILRVRVARCDDREADRRWSSDAEFVVGGDSPLETLN